MIAHHGKHEHHSHGPAKRPMLRRWALWRRVTAALFLGALVCSQFDWFPWFGGSTAGTRLLGVVPFVDPLAAIEVAVATRHVEATMLIGAGILIGAAMILGPVFCGFVCPMGLALDLNQVVRRLFQRVVFRKKVRTAMPTRVPNWVRYGLLGFFVGFAALYGLPLFQTVSPINLLSRGLVFGVWGGLLFVGVIVVVEWFVPRLWCRALCPLGALYSIIGRWAVLRVRIDPHEAGKIRCQQCQIRCPMGIPIMRTYTLGKELAVWDPSCIRCGDCIDVCPRSVLGLRLTRFPEKHEREASGAVELTVGGGQLNGASKARSGGTLVDPLDHSQSVSRAETGASL